MVNYIPYKIILKYKTFKIHFLKIIILFWFRLNDLKHKIFIYESIFLGGGPRWHDLNERSKVKEREGKAPSKVDKLAGRVFFFSLII